MAIEVLPHFITCNLNHNVSNVKRCSEGWDLLCGKRGYKKAVGGDADGD
ncbi:MAG: hypothetical protein ACK4OO_05550 [bacterium]